MMNFLDNFFIQYPEYQEYNITITGESFAGHYVPEFAW